MTVRVRAIVHGRVQGVWYRDTCRETARRLGVAGFARNTADGTVEIEAEGDAAAVERLLAWARVGPPRAVVTSVDLTDLEPTGRAGFSVR